MRFFDWWCGYFGMHVLLSFPLLCQLSSHQLSFDNLCKIFFILWRFGCFVHCQSSIFFYFRCQIGSIFGCSVVQVGPTRRIHHILMLKLACGRDEGSLSILRALRLWVVQIDEGAFWGVTLWLAHSKYNLVEASIVFLPIFCPTFLTSNLRALGRRGAWCCHSVPIANVNRPDIRLDFHRVLELLYSLLKLDLRVLGPKLRNFIASFLIT